MHPDKYLPKIKLGLRHTISAMYPMNPIERNPWLAKEILVHERVLRGYLSRFFKNVADVEDVVQETVVQDTYAAATVARSEGASLRNACEFAVRAAALSVTRFGAQPSLPSRLEADNYIHRTK